MWNQYDLAFYNQETILGGAELGLSGWPSFNSPYEVGDAFIDAGFNMVSTATNHTYDKKEKGVINSCNYWAKKDNVYMSGTKLNGEYLKRMVLSLLMLLILKGWMVMFYLKGKNI